MHYHMTELSKKQYFLIPLDNIHRIRSLTNTSAMQTFHPVGGIESFRLHPVLAAVKIEVPLHHFSGTLPSGGRSKGTGGDRLAHAS